MVKIKILTLLLEKQTVLLGQDRQFRLVQIGLYFLKKCHLCLLFGFMGTGCFMFFPGGFLVFFLAA